MLLYRFHAHHTCTHTDTEKECNKELLRIRGEAIKKTHQNFSALPNSICPPETEVKSLKLWSFPETQEWVSSVVRAPDS